MARDKRIDVRVSIAEMMQIKRHFGNENVSDYVRNHLLEISQDSKVDTSNEEDLYELFKQFLGDDKVAKDIFTRFAKETNMGDCTDVVSTKNDSELVWWQGKQITYDELKELEKGYKGE
ncbi:MAG: hypothetical protein RR745_05740 [Bacilli bacterium]